MSAAKRICTRETEPMSVATNVLPEDNVIEYEFVIKNFMTIQSQMEKNEIVESPIFPQVDGLPKWCITVYPRGDDAEKFKFKVEVALEKARLGKTSQVVAAKFRFLNDNRSVIEECDVTSRELPQGHVVFYYIRADCTLALPVSDSGDLIINVEITYGSQIGDDINILPSTFSRAFSSALQSGILSDFTMISSDKREFPVHKIILAMRVPHVERMFKADMSDVKKKRFDVDFSGDCVEAMLEYVYSDKVAKLDGIVVELLQLSHQYEIDRLMSICAAEIVKNLQEGNLCESLRIADLYGIIPLQSACRKFIKDSANAVKRICAREFQTVPLPVSFATYDFAENKVIDYEFVIMNFADTQSQLDCFVDSPLFPQTDLPQWSIRVYPRGDGAEKNKFEVQVALEKARLGKKSEVFGVKFKFLNDNRSVIREKPCKPREMSLLEVLFHAIDADSAEAIPVSDSGDLIVSVQITLVSPTGYDINVPPSTFLHTFSSALESGVLSDFTVVSSDQREFPVHKIILATRVPHFEQMFNSGLDEVKQNRVEVDFSGDCVEAMLEYVYNDEVAKLNEVAVELVQLATVYCMDRLVSICTSEIVKNLCQENLCESLCIADRYGIVSLQFACHSFIAGHPDATAKVILQMAENN